MTEQQLEQAQKNRGIRRAFDSTLEELFDEGMREKPYQMKFGEHKEEIKDVISTALRNYIKVLDKEFDKI